MSWVSLQEDNLDARVKSVKGLRSATILPKKTEVSSYEFEDKPLTQYIVETILIQWAERKTPNTKRNARSYLPVQTWAKYVQSYHAQHGGLPAKGDLIHIVGKALISLNGRGRSHQISRYGWKIF